MKLYSIFDSLFVWGHCYPPSSRLCKPLLWDLSEDKMRQACDEIPEKEPHADSTFNGEPNS